MQDIIEEVWKDIDGYEGLYQISNYGNVKTLSYQRTGIPKILSPRFDGGGYVRVALYKNGVAKTYSVHRLVAKHFIENPFNCEEVNHIDGNKTNNNVDNLEWVTSKENSSHAVISKLRILPTYKVLQYTLEHILIKEWNSVYEVCENRPYESSMIYKSCEGKLPHAYGYIWKYGARDSESNIYIGGESY
jgi:hypothetical protein